MFGCLYSLSAPQAVLLKVAQDFTPRFEVVGPLVILDLSGLTRLFGSACEIGHQLRQSLAGAPVRIAIASSQTAAALLALGRPGLTIVSAEEQPAALAPLSVALLGDLERIRNEAKAMETQRHGEFTNQKTDLGTRPALPKDISPCLRASVALPVSILPHAGDMEDVRPYFQSGLERTSAVARAAHVSCGGGWTHPRDAHAATHARRARRRGSSDDQVAEAQRRNESASAAPRAQAPLAQPAHTSAIPQPSPTSATSRRLRRVNEKDIQSLLNTLRRWGVKTLGALAALPPADVYERLGGRGVLWQRLAQGVDVSPLVPWVAEDPFEAALELEWPIEGLEPLSFVLARLFEPLSERLARADRGAAVLHTHLRLVTREGHARTVQLPAPMRDPKTLRTLVLLDLESNPPAAAVDRVRVLIEPTPARVLQWALFERAQPSPEQVSTLLARLTALMGQGHVGSPRLVDSWKPGAFEMQPFAIDGAARPATDRQLATALRRFRLPIPARVQVQDGRPVRVMADRRGIAGGAIAQAAGPWRTSGEWWNDRQAGQVGRVGQAGQVGKKSSVSDQIYQFDQSHQSDPRNQPYQPATAWDRDEWEVALADGAVYRIFVERDVGQWFIEGVVD